MRTSTNHGNKNSWGHFIHTIQWYFGSISSGILIYICIYIYLVIPQFTVHELVCTVFMWFCKCGNMVLSVESGDLRHVTLCFLFTQSSWLSGKKLGINHFIDMATFYKAFNTLRLRQNGRHFPDDISNGFLWMKMHEFWLKFHWSLFPGVQLTIFQHSFR